MTLRGFEMKIEMKTVDGKKYVIITRTIEDMLELENLMRMDKSCN